MKAAAPIETAHLFPGLHEHLVELLRGLAPEDWQRPTVAGEVASSGGWSVFEGLSPSPGAVVTLPADLAWRSFFNAASAEEVRAGATVSGDPELAEAVLNLRSVMV